MNYDRSHIEEIAVDVIAVAEKHRQCMEHLVSDFATRCIAFGQSINGLSPTGDEFQRMHQTNARIREELNSLVELARNYFSNHSPPTK